MDKECELRQKLKALFNSQALAVLATHRDDVVHGSLVAITVADDLKELVFVTSRSTRKYSHMSVNPNVALVVDNRTNSAMDFHQAIAVTITGIAEEVIGNERELWLERYLAQHPGLKAFASSPTCALVRIRVKNYSLVERFQNVTDLKMAP